ncbi:MAG: hypothetical protein LBV58_04395 [Acholeplasmatales bacterium]|jgi:pullulanase|nr:hypothetical protein [Acholeplasmatales bacterium]
MLIYIDGFRLLRVETDRYIEKIVLKNNTVTYLKTEGNSEFFSLTEDINLHYDDHVYVDGEICPLNIGVVTLTEEFNSKFYSKEELGAIYTKESTSFRFFGPTIKEAFVIIDEIYYQMSYCNDGTYYVSINGDFAGAKYYYYIRLLDCFKRVIDPYAKGVLNGTSYIVDDSRLIKETRLDKKDKKPYLYETSVKDITSTLKIENEGTFLGLLEKDKDIHGNVLDYIKNLGMTHVEFLPVFGFYGIDELDKSRLYNWGYNPIHYFSLTSHYSSSVTDPVTGINEFISSINYAHSIGLGVILDVVFNHVYSRNIFSYDEFVPGYFFRHDIYNKPTNGSLCGNEIETSRKMVRKFIVDNIKYFLKTFGVDGFRFDLLGLIDIKTMEEVVSSVKEINKNAIIIGEGWNIPNTVKEEDKAIIKNHDRLKNVYFFNDLFRNSLRGINDSNEDGLLTKHSYHKLEGLRKSFYEYLGNQSVYYVSCHDNKTLFDRLKISENVIVKDLENYVMTALGLVSFSPGISFYNSGSENLRTKFGIENSYNCLGTVNNIYLNPKSETTKFLKSLISLSKKYNLNSFDMTLNYDEKFDFYELNYDKKGETKLKIVFKNSNSPSLLFYKQAKILSSNKIFTLPDNDKYTYFFGNVGIYIFY